MIHLITVVFHKLSNLVPPKTLKSRYYYLHVTDNEIGAHRIYFPQVLHLLSTCINIILYSIKIQIQEHTPWNFSMKYVTASLKTIDNAIIGTINQYFPF
jgi:hypothetical protein